MAILGGRAQTPIVTSAPVTLGGPVRVSSYGTVGQDAWCLGAKEPLLEGPCSLG